MKTCYLHLGSNMGNRHSNLSNAIKYIDHHIGTILKKSELYETEAWGNTDQNSFYNIALKIKTKLNAFELLEGIQSIENKMGRIRKEHWGARIIDIDILFYGNDIIEVPDLIVPHPLLEKRKFVLMPLMDIAKNYVHPILKKQIRTLTKNCKDESEVKKIQ